MTKKSSIYEFSGCKGKTVKELLNGDVSVGRYFVCGGAGVCGACKAQIVSGELSSEGDVYSAGAVLRMCKSVVLSDNLRIMMPPKNSAQNSIFAEADFILPKGFIPESFSGLRAALDIGTTTLALVLYDASSRIIYRATSINPQCKYGADVVSRIAFAMSKEGLATLRECISHSVAKMLDDAISFANADCIEVLYVSGNCAMLHIFFGKEISGLATFPFNSDFLNSVECESFMGIKTKKIVSLPSIGAFVGADAVGACVNSGLFVKDCNSVMIDLGTNAEIVVKYKGQLFACSAPAGPAFEGGGFECSTKAQNGAICRVYIDGKPGLKYETIGNAPACGICASGYIDFLAEASHTGLTELANNVNRLRLGTDSDYYNSGVLLIDLEACRKEIIPEEVITFSTTRRMSLVLPDQDILNAMFGHRILPLDDSIWNYDTRKYNSYLARSSGKTDINWIFSHTGILHFCGRAKPWKSRYPYRFGLLYKHYEQLTRRWLENLE